MNENAARMSARPDVALVMHHGNGGHTAQAQQSERAKRDISKRAGDIDDRHRRFAAIDSISGFVYRVVDAAERNIDGTGIGVPTAHSSCAAASIRSRRGEIAGGGLSARP